MATPGVRDGKEHDDEYARHTAPQALCTRFHPNKVVRDLLWVVASPHLVDATQLPVLPLDLVGLSAMDTTDAAMLSQWLDTLYANPSTLYAFVQGARTTGNGGAAHGASATNRRPRRSHALGTYFALLLEFWLRFCPLLRVTRFARGTQIVSPTRQTLGQLKFLFRRQYEPKRCRDAHDHSGVVDCHVECSVKFFLLHPPDDDERNRTVPSVQRVPAALVGAVRDHPAATAYPLPCYVGPHLGETLAWRVEQVKRKLAITHGDHVRQWLREHYSNQVQSWIVLRGYLFYPLRFFTFTSQVANSAPTPTPTAPTNSTNCYGVGMPHQCGWWATNQELAAQLPPRISTGYREQQQDSDSQDVSVRFAVLPKLHWLAPVLAVEDTDGVVVIQGVQELAIESVETMTLSALLVLVDSHFGAQSSPTTNKPPTKEPHAGGHDTTATVIPPPLLVAELVRYQQGDIEFDASSPRWKEQSRGFVLHAAAKAIPSFSSSSPSTPSPPSTSVDATSKAVTRAVAAVDAVIRSSEQQQDHERVVTHQFVNATAWSPTTVCQELFTILSKPTPVFSHAQLKISITEVMSSQSSGSVLLFSLAALRYLVEKKPTKEEGQEEDRDSSPVYDDKTAQRVGHLVLDALCDQDSLSITGSDKDHKPSQSSEQLKHDVEAFMTLFQETVRDHSRWSFLHLVLRGCDIVHDLMSNQPQVSPSSAICCCFFSTVSTESIANELHGLLRTGQVRWNAVAVETVRVLLRPSCRRDCEWVKMSKTILTTLITQKDWLNAERLVTVCHDRALVEILFQQATALHVPKTVKRVRKMLIRHHDHQALDGVTDTATTSITASTPSPTIEACDPIDLDSNRAVLHDEPVPQPWSFVDTSPRVALLMDHLQQLERRGERCLIGLDCEWRPQAMAETDGVSTYQLSIGSRSYVVDVQVLGGAASAPLVFLWKWPQVFLVVGFALSADVARLRASFPILFHPLSSSSSSAPTNERMEEEDEEEEEEEEEEEKVAYACQNRSLLVELRALACHRGLPAQQWGLSRLHQVCCGGAPLEKTEQCSDWGLRPLSQQQLRYAAMDALAAQRIARVLLADIHERAIDFTAYVTQFAVPATPPSPFGLTSDLLRPLTTEDVRHALYEFGLEEAARSIFSLSSKLMEQQGDGDGDGDASCLVKTIAISITHGRHRGLDTIPLDKDSGPIPSMITRRYLAVVLRVDQSINMAALAHHLCVDASELVLADPETLERVFGYKRGGIGPMGLREQHAVHVVLEAALMQEERLLCGAGSTDVVFAIAPQVLQATVCASLWAIAQSLTDAPRSHCETTTSRTSG